VLIRSAIVSGISSGVQVREEGDRRRAIALAIGAASDGDCVLILGKGHETGQEISGETHHFDDREEVLRALANLGQA
jgi:UDP-N-acetylmuramoyl-L-alanyl-D-glutamate--2,6-diaminopimelate ligase